MENYFLIFLNYVDVLFIWAIERKRTYDFANWFHRVKEPVSRDKYGCNRRCITTIELNVSIQILKILYMTAGSEYMTIYVAHLNGKIKIVPWRAEQF